MKKTHKGFELEANREGTVMGEPAIECTATRISDGWCLDYYVTTDGTVNAAIKDMIDTVEDYLLNPELYDEEE